jgi:hypothetical protein
MKVLTLKECLLPYSQAGEGAPPRWVLIVATYNLRNCGITNSHQLAVFDNNVSYTSTCLNL